MGYAIDVPQPKHSFAHLLKSFVPRLKKAGISNSAINTMLIENPRRILANKVELQEKLSGPKEAYVDLFQSLLKETLMATR